MIEQRNWNLLQRPFIKPKEICEVVGTSKSTVSRKLKKSNLIKYEWGYETQKVITLFGLRDYFKWLERRNKKVDKKPTKHN